MAATRAHSSLTAAAAQRTANRCTAGNRPAGGRAGRPPVDPGNVMSRPRQLAAAAYGLQLPRLRLPPASLDHGLDLLEVVRHLGAFAPRFAYALHANCFVERPAFAAARRPKRPLAIVAAAAGAAKADEDAAIARRRGRGRAR